MHCLVTTGTSYPLPSLTVLSSTRYSHCIVCNQFCSQASQDFCQAQVSLQLLKYCFSLHSIEGRWNKSGYYSPSFADIFLCFLTIPWLVSVLNRARGYSTALTACARWKHQHVLHHIISIPYCRHNYSWMFQVI